MKKMIFTVLVISAMAGFLWVQSGARDLSQSDALKEPAIKTMPPQKMLVVEFKGDPNVSGQQGFGLLFKIFFSIPGARMAAPRARWLFGIDTPKTEWVGLYALPLPDQVANLPPGSQGARIEVWPYGEVAEILHVGSYADEVPTIEKLMKFIKDKGYEIDGPHEEEYLRGPESGPDASAYRTIIRYQVKKK